MSVKFHHHFERIIGIPDLRPQSHALHVEDRIKCPVAFQTGANQLFEPSTNPDEVLLLILLCNSHVAELFQLLLAFSFLALNVLYYTWEL